MNDWSKGFSALHLTHRKPGSLVLITVLCELIKYVHVCVVWIGQICLCLCCENWSNMFMSMFCELIKYVYVCRGIDQICLIYAMGLIEEWACLLELSKELTLVVKSGNLWIGEYPYVMAYNIRQRFCSIGATFATSCKGESPAMGRPTAVKCTQADFHCTLITSNHPANTREVVQELHG